MKPKDNVSINVFSPQFSAPQIQIAVQRCSMKKLQGKTSPKSNEDTCAGVYFSKISGLQQL